MSIIKRQSDERRSGKVAKFPMIDRNGVQVTHNRRHRSERRKTTASLEELLILFSQLPSENPDMKH